MGTAKRTRDIGAVPSGLTTDQQRFLEQVRRRLQDLSGTNGSRAGQAVTWDDLRAGGLVGGDLQIPAGGFTQDGTPDLTPPPTPVGLSAVAALTNIIITTSDPVFLVGHGYARTLVYGAQVTDQVPNPVFADAQKIHEFVGSVGSYPTDPGSRWRLWATWLSNDGVQSFTPAGPVDATTGLIDGHDLSDDLDLAEHLADGSISGSKLAAGAIDATKFANDIEPVTIVDAPSLPTTKSTTNIVWQGALYTWDGTEYKSPDIGDITFEDIGGTIDASQVAAGILDATKFASGLEPVTVVSGSTLPTAKSTSVIVFGGKLYRWNGSAYVASVLTTDISGTITSTQIEDGAISTPKLAANAVTASKIAADAVTADKIAANAVTTAKLAAGAVTADQIAAGAITASKLTVADYSNLITNSEFAGGSTEDWTLGTGVSLASAPSNMPCSYALQFNVVSSSRYTATYSKAIPCMPGESYYASMIVRGSGTGPQFNPRMRIEWFDRNNASLSVVWLSSQQTIVSPVTLSGIFVAPDSATQMHVQLLREVVTGESQNGYIARPVIRRAASAELIVDGAVTANKIAANAIAVGTAAIQDGAIVNAMIGAAAIDDAKVGNLSASKLTAGDGTIGGPLKSSNFVSGSSGWRVQPNGTAEFSGVIVRGTVYATAGQIGGATISSSYVQSANYSASNKTGWRLNNSDGSITAYSGTFGGNLSAAGGTFSGDLSAAGGTFSGDLSGAGGTFSGNLSAAGGTFAGTLTADAVNAVNTVNIAGNAVSVTAAYSHDSVTDYYTSSNVDPVVDLQDLTITTTGQMVVVMCTLECGWFAQSNGLNAHIYLFRDGSNIKDWNVSGIAYGVHSSDSSSNNSWPHAMPGVINNSSYFSAGGHSRFNVGRVIPASTFIFTDSPSAGSHTYHIRLYADSTGSTSQSFLRVIRDSMVLITLKK